MKDCKIETNTDLDNKNMDQDINSTELYNNNMDGDLYNNNMDGDIEDISNGNKIEQLNYLENCTLDSCFNLNTQTSHIELSSIYTFISLTYKKKFIIKNNTQFPIPSIFPVYLPLNDIKLNLTKKNHCNRTKLINENFTEIYQFLTPSVFLDFPIFVTFHFTQQNNFGKNFKVEEVLEKDKQKYNVFLAGQLDINEYQDVHDEIMYMEKQFYTNKINKRSFKSFITYFDKNNCYDKFFAGIYTDEYVNIMDSEICIISYILGELSKIINNESNSINTPEFSNFRLNTILFIRKYVKLKPNSLNFNLRMTILLGFLDFGNIEMLSFIKNSYTLSFPNINTILDTLSVGHIYISPYFEENINRYFFYFYNLITQLYKNEMFDMILFFIENYLPKEMTSILYVECLLKINKLSLSLLIYFSKIIEPNELFTIEGEIIINEYLRKFEKGDFLEVQFPDFVDFTRDHYSSEIIGQKDEINNQLLKFESKTVDVVKVYCGRMCLLFYW